MHEHSFGAVLVCAHEDWCARHSTGAVLCLQRRIGLKVLGHQSRVVGFLHPEFIVELLMRSFVVTWMSGLIWLLCSRTLCSWTARRKM